MLPMVILALILLVALIFFTEGDVLGGVFEVFPWGGATRKKEERGAQWSLSEGPWRRKGP